jgi:hypothetical protein
MCNEIKHEIEWLGNHSRAKWCQPIALEVYRSCALFRLPNEMEYSRYSQYGGHSLRHVVGCALLIICLASNCQASDSTTMDFIVAVLSSQTPATLVSAFICWQPRKLSGVLVQKLLVVHLRPRYTSSSVEPEVSLRFSKQLNSELYPEPDTSTPHPLSISL